MAWVAGAAFSMPLAGAVEQPNFIVINVDDLGYGDIGPFGSPTNATPNLDRMAAEGRKLMSHYAAPVCSPSRASLMTGCYPKRSLAVPHVLFPASPVGLSPEEVTVAEVLKEVGYQTACIGKWHLGDQPGMLPTDQGFDSYFGIPYSNDMGPIADGAKNNPGQPEPKAGKGKARKQDIDVGITGMAQPPLPLLENKTVIERVKQGGQTRITERYTDRAVAFVKENAGKPFFLYLAHTAVHFPLYPGMEWRGTSKNGLHGDWVQEVDWSVGEVLKAVREAGLAEKTLVVFTSDNGGALNHGARNEPLRGSKASTLEGGIRVGTIAWWPGNIPAGTETWAITSMMDVLPTFAGLGGGEVPQDRVIDGVDMWPALIGDATPQDRFFYFRGASLEAVRQGVWKLHLKNGELYNLDTDLGEATDVAKSNPEVVADLMKRVAEMDADLGIDAFGPSSRPLGRVEKPEPLIGADGAIRAGFEPK